MLTSTNHCMPSIDDKVWKLCAGNGMNVYIDEYNMECVKRSLHSGDIIYCVDIFGSHVITTPQNVVIYSITLENAKAECQYYYDVAMREKQWVKEFKGESWSFNND